MTKCKTCTREIENESDCQADMYHAEGKCTTCSQPTEEEREAKLEERIELMERKKKAYTEFMHRMGEDDEE